MIIKVRFIYYFIAGIKIRNLRALNYLMYLPKPFKF